MSEFWFAHGQLNGWRVVPRVAVPSIMARDALLRRPRLRMIVYKIVATEEWAKAQAAGVFMGAAVDRADGFIHFSTAEQAPETAAKWFAGRGDLTLAAIDAEALGDALALGAVAGRRALSSPLRAPCR